VTGYADASYRQQYKKEQNPAGRISGRMKKSPNDRTAAGIRRLFSLENNLLEIFFFRR
jgi:hypothetical protein